MNRRLLCLTLSTAALVLAAIFAPSFTAAQQSGDAPSSRGDFLKSRPKKLASRPAPRRQPPGKPAPAATSAIGLGYTLFQRDPGGRTVRVPASREFRSGDAVRLMIETNSDGYLYVFNTEDGRNQTMIFPDQRLNQANNYVRAHVPYEVPSSRDPDPNNRWFVFYEKPAAERLYLIFSREPLPNVLIGDRLIAHCKVNPQQCPWRPPDAAWISIVGAADVAARVEQSQDAGKEITRAEVAASSRSIGLLANAPAPSVVKMSSSAKAEKVMLVVDLAHK
jgi:hypothetical protein